MTLKQKHQSDKIAAIARRLILGDVPHTIQCGERFSPVTSREIWAALRLPHPYEAGTVGEAYGREALKFAAVYNAEYIGALGRIS